MDWFMEPVPGFNVMDAMILANCSPQCDCKGGLVLCICTAGLIVPPPN